MVIHRIRVEKSFGKHLIRRLQDFYPDVSFTYFHHIMLSRDRGEDWFSIESYKSDFVTEVEEVSVGRLERFLRRAFRLSARTREYKKEIRKEVHTICFFSDSSVDRNESFVVHVETSDERYLGTLSCILGEYEKIIRVDSREKSFLLTHTTSVSENIKTEPTLDVVEPEQDMLSQQQS